MLIISEFLFYCPQCRLLKVGPAINTCNDKDPAEAAPEHKCIPSCTPLTNGHCPGWWLSNWQIDNSFSFTILAPRSRETDHTWPQEELGGVGCGPHRFEDGTFTVAAALYYQIYTIHVLQSGRGLPRLYCLLRWKNHGHLHQDLCKILHLEPGLSPVTLLTNFKQAAIQAFRTVSPAAACLVCFLHLKQCVQRKVHESGLVSQ